MKHMIGELSKTQIDHVLASQPVGRIGCHADGLTYVVPVAYAYDGDYVYAHSRVGLKIGMMRKNPNVCFQVDMIEGLATWRSVILQGVFEELKTSAAQAKAFERLKERLSPLVTSAAAKPVQPPPGEKKQRPVFFRIRITSSSGRYEKP